MKLTGEALVGLVGEIGASLGWDEMDDETRGDFVRFASAIQNRHIAPLQQLVLDWQKFVLDDLEDNFGMDEMSLRWAELRQRTRELVGEEQVP